MGNPFVHVELNTTDLSKAKTFYQKFFDWKMDDMPAEDGKTYTMINVGEGTGGGMMAQPRQGENSVWLPYVMVDDINKAVDKAKSLGATVSVGPTEVKTYGWYAVILDPTGAKLGLWMNSCTEKCCCDKSCCQS